MTALLALISVIAGLAIVFGQRLTKTLGKFCLWLLVGPILMSFAFAPLIETYRTLPLVIQAGCWLVLPFALLIFLRALLPKSVWVNALFRMLFELLVFVATFPFRFLWRSLRLIADREHHSMNLARHYAAVGQRPPQIQRPFGDDYQRR